MSVVNINGNWTFPNGACELGYNNAQPISAILTFITTAVLFRTLYKNTRNNSVPWEFVFLIIFQIAFEGIHGICHAKNDSMYGQCYYCIHVVALFMLYGFSLVIDLLRKERHTVVFPLMVLVQECANVVLNLSELVKKVVAFSLFTYLFVRAATSITVRQSDTSIPWRRVVAVISLLQAFFYIDGRHCNWLYETFGNYPYHAVIEILGLDIFCTTNRILEQDLAKIKTMKAASTIIHPSKDKYMKQKFGVDEIRE